jgi:hypothetical protein
MSFGSCKTATAVKNRCIIIIIICTKYSVQRLFNIPIKLQFIKYPRPEEREVEQRHRSTFTEWLVENCKAYVCVCNFGYI